MTASLAAGLLLSLSSAPNSSVPNSSAPQAKVPLGGDPSVRPLTITPQMRLDAARRATKGLGNVSSVGATRTRTFLEKGTTDLTIGANAPKGYVNGIARFGTGSSFWTTFRAKPQTLYAVTVVGRFDCTGFRWVQDSPEPSVPGPATMPIGEGESAAVLGLRAASKEVVVFVSQPKGGKGEFLVSRVEITELK